MRPVGTVEPYAVVGKGTVLDVRPVPWEWMRFESELAAFSVLQARAIGPDGFAWSLQSFNEVDHLDREGLR